MTNDEANNAQRNPSQAVVLRWHLRGQNLDLAIRKAALSAQIETRKTTRNDPA